LTANITVCFSKAALVTDALSIGVSMAGYEFFITVYADESIPKEVNKQIASKILKGIQTEFIEFEQELQTIFDIETALWKEQQEKELIERIVSFCINGN